MVRRAATSRFGKTSFGRVYGFVYSGLDTGPAVSPLLFGPLLDAGRFQDADCCCRVTGVVLVHGGASGQQRS